MGPANATPLPEGLPEAGVSYCLQTQLWEGREGEKVESVSTDKLAWSLATSWGQLLPPSI